MKKLLLVLCVSLFMTSCHCEWFNSCDDDDPITPTCLEYGEMGCLGKGILAPDETGEEISEDRIYLYDCDLDQSNQLPFCDFENWIEQGETFGIKRTENGEITWFRMDYQEE